MTVPALDRYSPAADDGWMPRPYAVLVPDQPIEIELEQRGGGRVLVRGTLRRVPLLAGDQAMRLLVVDARAMPLEEPQP